MAAVALAVIAAAAELGKLRTVVGNYRVLIPLSEGQGALTEAFGRFDTAVNSWHGSIIDSFRVSYGRVSAGEHPDCSVEELIKIADDLMYEVKRGYYENKKI